MSFWNNTSIPTASIIETITQVPGNLIAPQNTSIEQSTNYQTGSTIETTGESNFSWATIVGILYLIGVVIFFLIFIIQVVILLTQRYNLNSFKTGKYTIVEMVKDSEPCSFLNYIYINPTKYDEETYDHIIKHEKAHIDQSHFVDKVIAELLIVLFWFNPSTWLLRKSISQNLEFLTDQSILNQGIQKDKYQMSLLKVSVSNRPLNLTASYNSSFLKSRINMMNSKNSSVVSAWKYLFIVPLFLLSAASLNAVQVNARNAQSLPSSSTEISTNIPPSESGHISKELNLSNIFKIGLAMKGTLVLSQGTEQKITVTGPKDIIEEISIEINDNNWNVDYKTNGVRNNGDKLTIYAQLTDLTHLALSSNGKIRCSNRFKNLKELYIAQSGTGNIHFKGDAKLIHTALSGNGNIRVESIAEQMVTAMSGAGNMSIAGRAEETKFLISGSGNIAADELESKRTTVISDGSTTLSLHTKDFLNVKASGSALVSYKGNPEIKKDLKSESRLEKLKNSK